MSGSPGPASPAKLRGPTGSPFIGNATRLSRDALEFLRECTLEYGDLVPLRFFWRRILFVNHPEYIEQVLATRQRSVTKDIFQRADKVLIGNGLFLSEGEFWLRQRRMMQPAFHKDRIAAYGQEMVSQAERMCSTWRAGEVRDIYRDMGELSMAIVAKALFDADVRGDAAEIAKALATGLGCLNARVRSVQILLPDFLPTRTNLGLRDASRRIDRTIYRIVAQRRAAAGDRGDLLSILLSAEDDSGRRMTDAQLQDEVMTMLIGGYETSADLMTWIWHLLSSHTEVRLKLTDELARVLGGRLPLIGDIPNLEYTGHIVSETLRLYPPAPALGREAIDDLEIGGHSVRRGTDLFVSQWVIQRDARYFDDPETFRPERWADGLAARIPRYAYFPFGGGPRQCIGAGFALMEATLVLATVAQRFSLTALPGHLVEAEVLPTLRPKHGLRMMVTSR